LINTVGCFGSEKEWIQDLIPIKSQVIAIWLFDKITHGCPENLIKTSLFHQGLSSDVPSSNH